jgi:RsiW-degrading membrane proteinase PrsW (M82 family)
MGPTSIYLILVFALIEELLKFLVVYCIFYPLQSFDEPLDAMIYMVTVALGFAAVENIAFILKSGASTVGLETLTLRFIGATLLHALSSGMIGYAWGKTLVEKKHSWISLPEGIFLGVIIHFLFNTLILSFGFTPYILLFLVCVAFFILLDFERLKIPINLLK